MMTHRSRRDTTTTPDKDDTIVAVATASGRSAVGVVRLSGQLTLPILERHCRTACGDRSIDFLSRPRRAIHSQLIDQDNVLIDDGLVTFFLSPASYTGDDSAEISLHGNPLLLRTLIDAILHFDGGLAAVRLARPGEFTLRAYLSGRFDLTRAEAVRRLIDARSYYELEAGRRVYHGELSRMVQRFRSHLIHLKAECEAGIDFSTEDLTFESLEERIGRAGVLLDEIEAILARGAESSRLAQGLQVALAGVPNAGKSSLLNLMLGWDRSIVSPIAGTTRDFVSETIYLAGHEVRFVDTAGLRDLSDDVLELEGIARARQMIDRSSLVVQLLDGAVAHYEPESFDSVEDHLLVVNKLDQLDDSWQPLIESGDVLSISCKSGEGVVRLREALVARLSSLQTGEPLLLEERQANHLERTAAALRRAIAQMMAAAPDEIVAIELDEALHETGAICGRIESEEVLGRIFSMFCVGK